jgi:hypothetical protein
MTESVIEWVVIVFPLSHDSSLMPQIMISIIPLILGSLIGVFLGFLVNQREKGFRDYKLKLNYIASFKKELDFNRNIVNENNAIIKTRGGNNEIRDIQSISNYYFLTALNSEAFELIPIKISNELRDIYYKLNRYEYLIKDFRNGLIMTYEGGTQMQMNAGSIRIDSMYDKLLNFSNELDEDLKQIVQEVYMRDAEERLNWALNIPWWDLWRRRDYDI